MIEDSPEISVCHDINRSLEIGYGGQSLLTYVYAPDDPQLESPRPYFHPMYSLAGDLVSLCRPHDHLWHKGLALSLPNVGVHNFWGGPTYVRDAGYVQLANNGSMDHQRFTALAATKDSARFSHELVWRAQSADSEEPGREIVRETRDVVVVVPSDDAWVLTFSSEITNVCGERLDLGSPTTKGRENAGYGGLFWRGPRSFTGGTIIAPSYSGGEEIRGTRAGWMGFSGQHDQTGRHSSVVVVDDSSNPQHPPQWFVRTELFAAVNPAPFFSAEVPFDPEEVMRLRYAVIVAKGASDADRGEELAGLGRVALGD